jgi:hypothetical protein
MASFELLPNLSTEGGRASIKIKTLDSTPPLVLHDVKPMKKSKEKL